MIEHIEKLTKLVELKTIIVTDIKDKALREKLNQVSEGRIFFVQKSGMALSALLCIIPL